MAEVAGARRHRHRGRFRPGRHAPGCPGGTGGFHGQSAGRLRPLRRCHEYPPPHPLPLAPVTLSEHRACSNRWKSHRPPKLPTGPGRRPLASVEGFVRQVVGWRSTSTGSTGGRCLACLRQPLARTRPLPAFFWDGDTGMNCLHHVVPRTRHGLCPSHRAADGDLQLLSPGRSAPGRSQRVVLSRPTWMPTNG